MVALTPHHVPAPYDGTPQLAYGPSRPRFGRHLQDCPCSNRGLVSIAEVHAVIARANLAQREPEMARDRFCCLQRHGTSVPSPLVGRFAPCAGLVTLRQTFVCRSQGGGNLEL